MSRKIHSVGAYVEWTDGCNGLVQPILDAEGNLVGYEAGGRIIPGRLLQVQYWAEDLSVLAWTNAVVNVTLEQHFPGEGLGEVTAALAQSHLSVSVTHWDFKMVGVLADGYTVFEDGGLSAPPLIEE